MNCLICDKSLGSLETDLNRRVHFECRHCAVCGDEMPISIEEIEKCLEKFGRFGHTTCLEKELWEDFKRKDLVLIQQHVNVLNKYICEARNPLAINELELFYSLLRDLQQCTANVKVVIDRTKDRLRMKQVVEYREKVERDTWVEKEADVPETKGANSMRLLSETVGGLIKLRSGIPLCQQPSR